MRAMHDSCPFCTPASSRVVAASDLALALRDAYPVSPDHTLVIPRRHVASFFDLTAGERAAMSELLDSAQAGPAPAPGLQEPRTAAVLTATKGKP